MRMTRVALWMTPVALIAVVPLLVGCSGPARGIGSGGAHVAYSDLRAAVSATFETRCVGCHNATAPTAGLSLVESRMDGALINVWSRVNDDYVLVKPGDPESSFLLRVLRGDADIRGAHMPPGGPRLSNSETEVITRWIASLAEPGGK